MRLICITDKFSFLMLINSRFHNFVKKNKVEKQLGNNHEIILYFFIFEMLLDSHRLQKI